ncbi:MULTISPECIES: hypothetical protein [Streptomyces]|uniref:hypothetical protein n=1 Tax=Streptomyces TaxID=1883 RepID=UPI00167636F9|nr:hypothetical protein [Streptomyces sp. FBKL.4005]
MSQNGTRSAELPQPLRAVASGLRRLPGAEQVSKAADSALDRIGAVSPRSRRMAVYAGAGVLGVAGVVEWPVALTGAAVAWLTQPRGPGRETPGEAARPAAADTGPAPAEAEDTQAERPGPGDRLAPSHFRHEHPGGHVHEQPAKVGDSATASALRQVAEASAHHDGTGDSAGHGPADRPR